MIKIYLFFNRCIENSKVNYYIDILIYFLFQLNYNRAVILVFAFVFWNNIDTSKSNYYNIYFVKIPIIFYVYHRTIY